MIWDVTLTDVQERFAPPQEPLLGITTIGDTFSLELFVIEEETFDDRNEKLLGAICVDQDELIRTLLFLRDKKKKEKQNGEKAVNPFT